MGKYDFKDLFQDGTILDLDFIKNEAGFDFSDSGLQPREQDIIFKDYYLNILNAISELHYLKPKREDIEKLLNDGFVIINDEIIFTNVSTKERKYLFLMAQAKQLLFDMGQGRTSMMRIKDKDEREVYLVADDTKIILNRLGFIDNGTFFRR